MDHKQTVFPPGLIGVASYFLGRYREFDYCLARLSTPSGSTYQYYLSVDVCHNFNLMVREFLATPWLQWIWIMGDDHLFNPDLLLKLLERDVDVVVPLCCRRMNPYYPVLQGSKEDGWRTVENPWAELKGKSGLFPWTGTTGNAGLLIKRHVLEKMTDPWFENGKTAPGVGGSDLYFWHKLRQAGFTPYIDLDNIIGHITHTSVWPQQNPETGEWSYIMRSP